MHRQFSDRTTVQLKILLQTFKENFRIIYLQPGKRPIVQGHLPFQIQLSRKTNVDFPFALHLRVLSLRQVESPSFSGKDFSKGGTQK